MSQTLTVELPDEVYEAVERMAEATGTTPAEWLAKDLAQRLGVRDGSTERDEQPLEEQFSKELLETFQAVARRHGRTIEEVAAEWVAKYRRPQPRPPMTEQESRAAWERLQRHCGAASLGYPTGADNESIDADLAREYGSTHEEET
ncbi:MAG: hypothetical protein HY314_16010 [Acidobacteria bacterium]|nr:hypothetical protein [Acidobacteriota bacterium]